MDAKEKMNRRQLKGLDIYDGRGQTISQSYIAACMGLQLKPDDKFPDVGRGFG